MLDKIHYTKAKLAGPTVSRDQELVQTKIMHYTTEPPLRYFATVASDPSHPSEGLRGHDINATEILGRATHDIYSMIYLW